LRTAFPSSAYLAKPCWFRRLKQLSRRNRSAAASEYCRLACLLQLTSCRILAEALVAVVFSKVLAIDLYVNTFRLYVRGAPDCAGLAMAGKDILQWELHFQVLVLYWSAPKIWG
jgi:hypothetical protein